MAPYILLISLSFLGDYIAFDKQRKIVSINKKNRCNNKSISVQLFFILLLGLLIFRDESVGRDINNYKAIFRYCGNIEFKTLEFFEMDILYKYLCWGVAKITNEFQIFLGLVAFLAVIPIVKLYTSDKRYGFIKIILFVNLSVFVMLFSGIRQSIAIGIGIFAYFFVKKKKIICFLITVLIAIGFHHSAIVLIFMYPLYYVKLEKISMVWIIPAWIVTFIFRNNIFIVIIKYLKLYSDKYDADLASNGAITSLLLFIIFVLFAYIIPDESKMSDETKGFRNFLIFSVFIQCFASVNTLAMRMNYYYIIFIPVLISKILSIPQTRYKKVSQLAEIVIVIFFTMFFLRTVYIGCATGISALDTYPWIPYWK